MLREGACKRVAEQPPSGPHGNLLSETAQWTQCSAKGPMWPWWVFSALFCGFFGQSCLVCFSSSFDSDWVEEANGWHLCWEFRPTPWGPSLNSNGTPSDYFHGFSHKLVSFPGKKRPWNCLYACLQEGNANDNHSNSVYSLLCSRCFFKEWLSLYHIKSLVLVHKWLGCFCLFPEMFSSLVSVTFFRSSTRSFD